VVNPTLIATFSVLYIGIFVGLLLLNDDDVLQISRRLRARLATTRESHRVAGDTWW
jgi:hypothetical protein